MLVLESAAFVTSISSAQLIPPLGQLNKLGGEKDSAVPFEKSYERVGFLSSNKHPTALFHVTPLAMQGLKLGLA